MKRATEALEQGNTKFVARGKNRELFEEMKRKFEEEKNGKPDSKRKKLMAIAAAPHAESNSSDSSSSSSSSSSDSENESPEKKSSSSHKVKSIESAVKTEPASEEQIEELTDDAHFVSAIVEWFDCNKKHKKALIQGIKNAFSEIAPLIYKCKTTLLGDNYLATQMPNLDKFFDHYDINDYGTYFSISLDAYNPTLCKVTWVWTKPAEARQQAKQPHQFNHELAMAWQAEMQKREEAWRAYNKTPEAQRVHCMGGGPVTSVPSGHYKVDAGYYS